MTDQEAKKSFETTYGYPEAYLTWTTRCVLLDKYMPEQTATFDAKRIRACVLCGKLLIDEAVRFAFKHFGYGDTHVIKHGYPPRIPSDDTVRGNYRKIPYKYLTDSEKAIFEKHMRNCVGVYPGLQPMYEAVTGR